MVEISFSLHTLAVSHFNPSYFSHAILFFWTSFFGVSIQCRSLIRAKEAQMGVAAAASPTDCESLRGHFPQLCQPILWRVQLHLAQCSAECVIGLWPKCYNPNRSYSLTYSINGFPKTHLRSSYAFPEITDSSH